MIAVVSGLGPNGMLAALKLRSEGFEVIAADQRPSYTRSIHLNLRRSWLESVRALDSALASKLESVATPIASFQGGSPHPVPLPYEGRGDSELWRRLSVPPSLHVRLDELERVFHAHLASLPGVEILRDTRVSVLGDGCFSARLNGRLIDKPSLIVAAEGGKSPTAKQLGLAMVKVSAPRFYISVHVDFALGPVTRRLDVDGVSYWAVGHGDPSRGTWLVLEIPEAVHAGRPSSTFDRDYYARAAERLLGLVPEPSAEGLRGTFRFEQQLMARPAAGENLVFFGDSAGMGHHALGTGLELGAWDSALLTPQLDIDEYASRVRDARIELLAFGMHEYDPLLRDDPTPSIRARLTASSADA